jgi:DNA-binding NarL/FixJ family response regulator
MKNMSHEQALSYAAAVKLLDDWAETVADRDPRIQQAHRAGMSNTEIAHRMKISRGTVIAVLGTDDNDHHEDQGGVSQ